MFFAAAHTPLRRQFHAQAGRSAERFVDEVLTASRQPNAAYTQDETAFKLSLDMPGIAKDQLSIAIDGAVVRIQSKDGAPRRYRAAYELPQEIDSALSEAKLENGVLNLKLVKKVPINSAIELTVH